MDEIPATTHQRRNSLVDLGIAKREEEGVEGAVAVLHAFDKCTYAA